MKIEDARFITPIEATRTTFFTIFIRYVYMPVHDPHNQHSETQPF